MSLAEQVQASSPEPPLLGVLLVLVSWCLHVSQVVSQHVSMKQDQVQSLQM